MRPHRVLFGVVLSVVITASACGEPDLDLAEAGLLTADDLGAGWTAAPGAEGGVRPFRSDAGDEAPEACADLILQTEAGTIADGQSASFLDRELSPEIDGFVVAANFVSVFRDDAGATRAHDAWNSADEVQPCLELLMGIFAEIGATDPVFSAVFGAYDVVAEPLDVPSVGDGVIGWRGALELETAALPDGSTETLRLVLDVVAVRSGRAVSQVMFMGIQAEPPAAARDGAVAAVAARLSAEI